MPWHQVETNRYGALTQTEIEDNAYEMLGIFTEAGWHQGAIAGMYGNIESEGAFNPAQWQGDKVVGDWDGPTTGYGMYQFTPPRKYKSYADARGINVNNAASNGPGQCHWVMDNPSQWAATVHPFSWYITLDDPDQAARAWMIYWERPADQSEAAQRVRVERALTWYEWISGHPWRKKLKIWLLWAMSRRRLY